MANKIEWTEANGRHPSRCEGYWRWTLPDSEFHSAPDLLPKEVFDNLKSKEKFPWLFATTKEAIDAANTAAEKANNPVIRR